MSARRSAGLAVGIALFVTALLASLGLGARSVGVADVVGALVDYDGSPDQIAVRELRLPRTLVGLVVGIALGFAGTLMQGLTRNPVADPGLLGVSAGAALGVVVAVVAGGVTTLTGYVWFAIVGAMIGALIVVAVPASRHSSSPAGLVLAGAAVSATLGSLTASILALDQQTLDQYRFWSVGSLQSRDFAIALDILPFIVVGVVLAVATAPGLDALALGDDVAQGLGRNVAAVRAIAGLAIVLLTGTAVAAAGPIAFIGLITPHLVRPWSGVRHVWVLLFAAVYAPSLLLWADVVGRLLIRPAELPVGIVTAVIGAPVLIWVIRRDRASAREATVRRTEVAA